MPQTARFPGGMTALEVVEYLTWMRGVPARTARARARRALDRVLLGDRADTKVKHLSGGMVRRIALAQAIAAEPAVLLLDEPSTGLDPEQRRTMVELIAQIDRELETTVLLSSHVMEDVTDVAARVVVLDAGRIVFTGSVAQLSQQAPTGTRLAPFTRTAAVPGATRRRVRTRRSGEPPAGRARQRGVSDRPAGRRGDRLADQIRVLDAARAGAGRQRSSVASAGRRRRGPDVDRRRGLHPSSPTRLCCLLR